MEIKSMVLALLFGALIMVGMLSVMADFSRPETYGATLPADSQANLTRIATRLNEMQDKMTAMKGKLDNSTATQPGDSSAIGWVFRTPALFTLGISTLQMIFDLPDYIGTFVSLVLTTLPFGTGYLVFGIVGIIMAILVFQVIKALTGVDV